MRLRHGKEVLITQSGEGEFSTDELANTVLDAIRTVVRHEVERVLPSRTLPQRTKDQEPNRPVALSKAKAAQNVICV
jgi:hypothetical protein